MSDHCVRHEKNDLWDVSARFDGPPIALHGTERSAVREAMRLSRRTGGGTVSVYGRRGDLRRLERVKAQYLRP